MIAYNKIWLDNLRANDAIQAAFDSGAISKEEKENAQSLYPVGFYTPNQLIRIALFILTIIIGAFSLGLLSLSSLDHFEQNFKGLLLFFSLVSYAALEYFVQAKKHYQSGVDDALLYISGIGLITSFNLMADLSYLQNAGLIFILSTFFLLRFADMLMAAVAVLSLLAVAFFSYLHVGFFAKATMPFLLMILCAGMYIFTKKAAIENKFRYYVTCLSMIEITVLLCFYAAENYFVVREVSNEMFDMDLKPGENIPFAWLFWIFTITIPLLYIIRGLMKKDPIILRVGLLLVAVTVYTVRYYHAVLQLEVFMLFAGILLILISYFVTKYLASPKHGFTSAEINRNAALDKLNAEAFIIAQTFGDGSQQAPDTTFGGGSFGGGGTSGDF